MADKYWMGWSDAYIMDVEEESPENMTLEYRVKIADFFKKMATEHMNNKRLPKGLEAV